MKPELYKEVALVRDIPEEGLRAGDVATLVVYAPHPDEGEAGAVLERFNAIGESMTVVVIPISAIAALQADQVPAVRSVSIERSRVALKASNSRLALTQSKMPVHPAR